MTFLSKRRFMTTTTGALIATLPVGSAGRLRAELTVSTDFEGGSASVDAIDSVRREIHVRPGGDPARGWTCWWYLKIDGLADVEQATLVVRGSDRPARNGGADTGEPLNASWALPTRAVVSHAGATWQHTQPGVREGDRASYALIGTGGPLWVAWVAQGFVEWVLGGEPDAAWLREHADVFVIPVMDVDRVATGSTYHPLWRQISSVWVSEHTNTDTVAACLETAWNTPHSTVAGYRDVGAKLGRAVTDYLRDRDEP